MPIIPLAFAICHFADDHFTQVSRKNNIEKHYSQFEKDFVCKDSNKVFITMDHESNTLLMIYLNRPIVNVKPVGKVTQNQLKLFPYHKSKQREKEQLYKKCLNDIGENIFDKYNVNWDSQKQKYSDYPLEKFERVANAK